MNKRILIVEDEITILQLLSLVLAKAGYEVHTCQSGRDAIARMKEVRPHLVILDVMLPGLDGRAVASIMEQDDELSGIPIIVTSALVESEHMFQPFPQVKAFCAKPFVLKDLVIKVKQCLGDA
ncbi:response regulator [Candidatus Avelusimicrobium facis]|uniref:response regulator n=1 Tax=Candidatus Avelusimicrobium facis TaxID=3416203 RepID=UPI0015B3921A